MTSSSRFNMDQLRHQARDLVRAHARKDATVCPMLRRLREFTGKTDAEVLARPLKLSQAQYALALAYGYTIWTAMKLASAGKGGTISGAVVTDGEALQITAVDLLAWDSGRECTLFGAMAAALKAAGEPAPYFELMGLGGAAFRFRLCQPGWDYSAVDGQLGYDHASAALRGLGREVTPQWSPSPDPVQRARIRDSLKRGVPALGIDLHVAPEWAVIAGYTSEGHWLCRSYFEGACENPDQPTGTPYVVSDRWPWLSVVIGERQRQTDRVRAFREAVRIAIEIAHQGWFTSGGGSRYISGVEALEVWASDLLTPQRFDPSDTPGLHHHASVNQFMYDSLQDARSAAVAFLRLNSDVCPPARRQSMRKIIRLYTDELTLLGTVREHLPGHPDDRRLTQWNWTPAMRRAQSQALVAARQIEGEAVDEMTRLLPYL